MVDLSYLAAHQTSSITSSCVGRGLVARRLDGPFASPIDSEAWRIENYGYNSVYGYECLPVVSAWSVLQWPLSTCPAIGLTGMPFVAGCMSESEIWWCGQCLFNSRRYQIDCDRRNNILNRISSLLLLCLKANWDNLDDGYANTRNNVCTACFLDFTQILVHTKNNEMSILTWSRDMVLACLLLVFPWTLTIFFTPCPHAKVYILKHVQVYGSWIHQIWLTWYSVWTLLTTYMPRTPPLHVSVSAGSSIARDI